MQSIIQITRHAWLLGLLFFSPFLASCAPTLETPQQISITIEDFSGQKTTQIALGTTVQTTLEKAGLTLNNLDKIDPPSYTVLTAATTIRITRVTETFEVETAIIPFERQTVRNESLPDGQTMLIQPGQNGESQTTYRRVSENGVEISRSIMKTETLKPPLPEIVMVGVQTPFTPVSIPGRLAYLTSGNAWIMESSTGERRPIITSGDLDGRIFNLSNDGKWLLFTRKSEKDAAEEINTLWMVNVEETKPNPIYLRVKNVIHFASWIPGKAMRIAYSTVEPRATAPGWQANNDLFLMTINDTGGIIAKDPILEASSGGIYGWWGTNFFWAQDGRQLAYARPDSIGLVDFDGLQTIPLTDLIPLQTRGDWAWVPGVTWSPDKNIIYTVIHSSLSGLTSDEASPLFDLVAINTQDGFPIKLVSPSGMFAYPVVSPSSDDFRFSVAYLQAIFPEQSETSRYKLVIMNQDGSNRNAVFPPAGSPGLDPQQIYWSPSKLTDNNLWIALIYQGNLWLINPQNPGVQPQQITGDNSINKIDWK